MPIPPAAFRSGAVMGFLLAGNALLVLFLLLLVLKKVFGDDWEGLYEVGACLPAPCWVSAPLPAPVGCSPCICRCPWFCPGMAASAQACMAWPCCSCLISASALLGHPFHPLILSPCLLPRITL
jgi:hypothetical protein